MITAFLGLLLLSHSVFINLSYFTVFGVALLDLAWKSPTLPRTAEPLETLDPAHMERGPRTIVRGPRLFSGGGLRYWITSMLPAGPGGGASGLFFSSSFQAIILALAPSFSASSM